MLGGAAWFASRPDNEGTPCAPANSAHKLPRRLRRLASQRLHALPCFAASDYVGRYPDVAASGLDPAFHALFMGAAEGRALFGRDRLARTLGQAATAEAPPPPPAHRPLQQAAVGVFVSGRGNGFMHELAHDVAAGLRATGADVVLRDESRPAAPRPPLCLYVAPHEFFTLGGGPAWVRADVVADGIMLNTEQPQTAWFARALPFLLAARGVVDLGAQTAPLLAATGVAACHVTPCPAPGAHAHGAALRRHPLYRCLPSAALPPPDRTRPLSDRPIDVAFFGSLTPHREAWFARHAGVLAALRCALHTPRPGPAPLPGGTDAGGLGDVAAHAAGHAAIMLNVHRDEYGFFEWHRIVRLGMAAGCAVVSEPCPPHPLFRAGVHYFEAPGRQIPELLDWLLHAPDGRAQAQRVADAAAQSLPRAFAAGALLAFLHTARAA